MLLITVCPEATTTLDRSSRLSDRTVSWLYHYLRDLITPLVTRGLAVAMIIPTVKFEINISIHY